MTQLEAARQGRVTREVEVVAAAEGLSSDEVRRRVAAGEVVVPSNRNRSARPVGIGRGLTVKVNANLGTSLSHADPEEELAKLDAAVAAGADSVMDLSTGGDLDRMLQAVLDRAPVIVGTVPLYAAAARLQAAGRDPSALDPEVLFAEIAAQCAAGVDFITVHCGLTRRSLERLERSRRITGIVSRGGSLLAHWMTESGRENPLYEQFDRLLAIAREHDVTLSLGDGLRPGCLADATDAVQLDELATLGELTLRARDAGVQVMVEGPGHVPLHQVAANVELEKVLCHGAPFYVLGPLVTDSAAGHDHIAGAIGGAVAAMAGADFLCTVSPAEHLRLPTVDEVREGVIASRIAGHAADVARRQGRGRERDDAVSDARRRLDWDGMFRHLLDPVTARHKRSESEDVDRDVCTMCGDLCAVKRSERLRSARR